MSQQRNRQRSAPSGSASARWIAARWVAAGVLATLVSLSVPAAMAADASHRKPAKPAIRHVVAHKPDAHKVTAHKVTAHKATTGHKVAGQKVVVAHKPAAVKIAHGKPISVKTAHAAGFVQQGKASWYDYGHDEHRRTASGHQPTETDLTAAHRTLPFNTKVRVTNLRNGRSVVVTINDRGPFGGGRIIDLNKRAAAQIGLVAAGVGTVRIEKVTEVAELPLRSGHPAPRG